MDPWKTWKVNYKYENPQLIKIIFCDITQEFTPPVGKKWAWPYGESRNKEHERVVHTSRYQQYLMLCDGIGAISSGNLLIRRENGYWNTGDFLSCKDTHLGSSLIRTLNGWLITYVRTYIVIPDPEGRCDVVNEIFKYMKYVEEYPEMGYDQLLELRQLITFMAKDKLFEKPMAKSAGKRS